MDANEKPFGWEVDVEFCEKIIYIPGSEQNEVKTFHYRGSRSQARRRGLLKPNARAVLAVRPVTEEKWLAAYGIGRM